MSMDTEFSHNENKHEKSIAVRHQLEKVKTMSQHDGTSMVPAAGVPTRFLLGNSKSCSRMRRPVLTSPVELWSYKVRRINGELLE